jgi:hypothetical protein
MIDASRFDELIEGLMQKTQEGKIPWESTALGDRFIAAVGGRYSIVIEESEPHQKYILSIRDLRDREIVRLGDYWGSKPDKGDPECIYSNKLRELFKLVARFRAIEGEAAVEGVLKALDVL